MVSRVLLVDDHEVVRRGCRRALDARPNLVVVAEASSGEDAYRMYRKLAPDVAVIDLSLPAMSGLETVRRIVARNRTARVVVFTMYDSEVLARRAFEAGALGYVLKTSPLVELVEAVEAVVSGCPYMSPSIAASLALNVEIYAESSAESSVHGLSPREFEIFRLVAEGRPNRDIAAQLNVSKKTVSNHLATIKRKLGISTTAEMTRLAVHEGILEL